MLASSLLKRRDFLRAGLALPLLGKPGRGKSCILLMLTGGPSHLDTWDMKPDAPREIRGPFRPIRTNVPGIEISEIFPRMARHADKFALIRSVHYDGPALHETGAALWEIPGIKPIRLGIDFEADCRRAVRLLEAGVRFVKVEMFDTVFDRTTWDAHGSKPFSMLRDYRDVVGPMFDRGYSGLLDDLSQRGLLDSTLVVAAGEFGRGPKINPVGGRDHWPQCWTVVMAGGGIAGGQVHGSSDAMGFEPRDHPVTPGDIVQTIHGSLAII
jgi:hypothetical protein